MTDSEVRILLERADSLINSGKWRAAHIVLDEKQLEEAYRCTAHFWFRLALVAGLIGRERQRIEAWKQARTCTDYDLVMDGDFLRDAAIAAMKRGEVHRAAELLDEAEQLHTDDPNRLACIMMVRGRIALRRSDWVKALRLLDEARVAFTSIPVDQRNEQWLLNLRLHLLFALVIRGIRHRASKQLQVIKRQERNRKRITLALLAYYGRAPIARYLATTSL